MVLKMADFFIHSTDHLLLNLFYFIYMYIKKKNKRGLTIFYTVQRCYTFSFCIGTRYHLGIFKYFEI